MIFIELERVSLALELDPKQLDKITREQKQLLVYRKAERLESTRKVAINYTIAVQQLTHALNFEQYSKLKEIYHSNLDEIEPGDCIGGVIKCARATIEHKEGSQHYNIVVE